MKRRIALVGALALVLSVFTAPGAYAAPTCGVVGDTLVIEEPGNYELTLEVARHTILADHEGIGGACGAAAFDVRDLGIDVVEITQYASVTFVLDDDRTRDLGDWAGLEFEVAVTSADVVFDAGDLDGVSVDVQIGPRGRFSIEHGSGDLETSEDVRFVGGDGSDTFDARGYHGDTVAVGGYGDDALYGGNGRDELDCADAGNDECWGGPDDDELAIGSGDSAAPGDGDDVIDASGTHGDWTLTYADVSSGILYDKEASAYVRSSSGDDRITGYAPRTMVGSRYGDEIVGDDQSETIEGGDGSDLIRGHEGRDRISGGSGDDRLFGGRDADEISGGDGNDMLYGRWGADLLRGDAGFDRMNGGYGLDVCGGEIRTACER